jgi:hypothetical protein
MEPELEAVSRGEEMVEIRYLDQALHRTPKKMLGIIQQEINKAARYAEQIVLGYALCSNGVVGLEAPRQGLFIPRCHDCISLFLGSPAAYQRAFRERPGTYYLTPGWVAEGKDPLGILENEYIPRFGRETGKWIMEEELKHYTHIVLIDTGLGDLERLRERARKNARCLGKRYDEIKGSLEYFRKLVHGPFGEEDFVFVDPGGKVTQDMFFKEEIECESG